MSKKILADLDDKVLNRLIDFLEPISAICFGLTSKRLHDLGIANSNAKTLMGVLLTGYVQNHVCLCWCDCEGSIPSLEFNNEEGVFTWEYKQLLAAIKDWIGPQKETCRCGQLQAWNRCDHCGRERTPELANQLKCNFHSHI